MKKKKHTAGFTNPLGPRESRIHRILQDLAGSGIVARVAIAKLAELAGETRKDTTLGVINLFLKNCLTYSLSEQTSQTSEFILEGYNPAMASEGKEGGYRGEKREHAKRCVTQRSAAFLRNNKSANANASAAEAQSSDEKTKREDQGVQSACSGEVQEKPIQSSACGDTKSQARHTRNISPKAKDAACSGDKATQSSAPTAQPSAAAAEEGEVLAQKIARGLAEPDKDGLYRWYLERFGREAVVAAFDEAKRVPDSKLKASRAALFTYLLKKHGQSQ